MGITTLEAVQHVKHYMRQTGLSSDEAIRRLCESLVEEGIGETILGTFDFDDVRTDVRVKNVTRYFARSKQWNLSRELDIDDIQDKLGMEIVNLGVSGDEKVKNEWHFSVDGKNCAIWDYKGARWSAFGPKEVFDKLGLDVEPG